jgi:hypothetical protein
MAMMLIDMASSTYKEGIRDLGPQRLDPLKEFLQSYNWLPKRRGRSEPLADLPLLLRPQKALSDMLQAESFLQDL